MFFRTYHNDRPRKPQSKGAQKWLAPVVFLAAAGILIIFLLPLWSFHLVPWAKGLGSLLLLSALATLTVGTLKDRRPSFRKRVK